MLAKSSACPALQHSRDACTFLESLPAHIYLSRFSSSPCCHSQVLGQQEGESTSSLVGKEGLGPSSARAAREQLRSQQTPVTFPQKRPSPVNSCSRDSNLSLGFFTVLQTRAVTWGNRGTPIKPLCAAVSLTLLMQGANPTVWIFPVGSTIPLRRSRELHCRFPATDRAQALVFQLGTGTGPTRMLQDLGCSWERAHPRKGLILGKA